MRAAVLGNLSWAAEAHTCVLQYQSPIQVALTRLHHFPRLENTSPAPPPRDRARVGVTLAMAKANPPEVKCSGAWRPGTRR